MSAENIARLRQFTFGEDPVAQQEAAPAEDSEGSEGSVAQQEAALTQNRPYSPDWSEATSEESLDNRTEEEWKWGVLKKNVSRAYQGPVGNQEGQRKIAQPRARRTAPQGTTQVADASQDLPQPSTPMARDFRNVVISSDLAAMINARHQQNLAACRDSLSQDPAASQASQENEDQEQSLLSDSELNEYDEDQFSEISDLNDEEREEIPIDLCGPANFSSLQRAPRDEDSVEYSLDELLNDIPVDALLNEETEGLTRDQ
jgi:hypothetical protein